MQNTSHVGRLRLPLVSHAYLVNVLYTHRLCGHIGNTYCVYDVAQSQNGYYVIHIGDEPDERSWKFMDKWLKSVEYTLF